MTHKLMVEIEISPLISNRELAWKHIENLLDAINDKWWDDNVESFMVRAMRKDEDNGAMCEKCPFKLVK